MKLDRLLGIVVLLSKNDKMTAPQLAEYFEVSKRTINRDIDALCVAGIPIVTRQGNNGGISIQEGYKIDKNVFKETELSEIITGLKALDSISRNSDIDMLMNKIMPDNKPADDIVKIELGSFYKDSIADKVHLIKQAVSKSRKVRFTYYSKRGKSEKIVEPYNIFFKWDNWYLYGYSNDFRMYKLNRLWDLSIIDEDYVPRGLNIDVEQIGDIFDSNYHLKAVFDKSIEYRLVEEYGNKSYKEIDEGLLFEMDFTNYDYMLGWALQFGDKVTVYEPVELVDEMKQIAKRAIEIY